MSRRENTSFTIMMTNIARSIIIITISGMEIAELVVETISYQHRNRFPLPNPPGAPAFHRRDVTTFLHKYESLANFTAPGIIESSVVTILSYYLFMTMPNSEVLIRQNPSSRFSAPTITSVLWREVITKLDINLLKPYTYNYCKLKDWIDGRCSTVEALAIFEILTSPTSTVTAPSELMTSSAPMAHSPSPTCVAPMTAIPLMTSATPTTSLTYMTMIPLTASTASVTPLAPTISTTAHTSPTATDMTSTSSGTASPMTLTVSMVLTVKLMAPMTSENMTTLMSPMTLAAPSTILTTHLAPIASTAPMAPTACTLPTHTHTARQARACQAVPIRIHSNMLKRLYNIELSKPRQPCSQEPVTPNRQEPITPNCQQTIKLLQSEPIVPSHNQPVSPYYQKAVQAAPCQEPVQPLQPVDYPPCYYYADDHHNIRKCTDLCTDVGNGIISINNHDPLILQNAASQAQSLSPPPPPPPAQSSRTSIPLLLLEQLTQLMREVTEHFVQSRWYKVYVQDPPLPPPAELSHTSVTLPRLEQWKLLVQEIMEYFAQPHPRHTARPPPAAT
ncbi:hypothetical protein K440DRAFT_679143 [Wilcoxina mikolae CBS 423.85]|nr:hypothetical protein K440DRAFT_679143 [Wilcoxina mikolae CBS 423.85]